MSKKTKRTYQGYDTCRKRLTRDGIKNPGKTASFLFDVFVAGTEKIIAENVVDRGLCGNLMGDFAFWRKQLVDKSWISPWSKSYGHEPGAKLIRLVNKERTEMFSIATTRDVSELKSEIDDLRKVVQSLIEDYDPPYTTEKEEKRLKLIKND